MHAGVTIRWCPWWQGFGQFGEDGMTVSRYKILLNHDLTSKPVADLAHAIAHQMCHVRQYRDWGDTGFRCRYMDAGGDAVNWMQELCEHAEARVKLHRCFRINNNSPDVVYPAFHYYSQALGAWLSRGWYTAPAGEVSDFCFTRTSYLYAHFFSGEGTSNSELQYSGGDAISCIAASPFETARDYKGAQYYAVKGPGSSPRSLSGCKSVAGYYLAQFEHLTGGAGGTFASARTRDATAARRLLLLQGGAGSEGTGGYGEHGESGEVEMIELSVEEVEAVVHGDRGDRSGPVFVDTDEDDMSDMTAVG